MKEEWRDIKGYEGLYQVSNLGRIKSLNYKRTKKEEILSNIPNTGGYLHLKLCKNGKSKPFLVHKLVAQAFIPNPNNYKEVNHKDENKQNNCIENLEWCTREYNMNYGTRIQRASEKMKGSKNPMYGRELTKEHRNKISKTRKEKGLSKGSKNPKAHKVKCVTTGKEFSCIKEAAEYYSINKKCITMCCRDKIKSAGKHPTTGEKLVWKYID